MGVEQVEKSKAYGSVCQFILRSAADGLTESNYRQLRPPRHGGGGKTFCADETVRVKQQRSTVSSNLYCVLQRQCV